MRFFANSLVFFILLTVVGCLPPNNKGPIQSIEKYSSDKEIDLSKIVFLPLGLSITGEDLDEEQIRKNFKSEYALNEIDWISGDSTDSSDNNSMDKVQDFRNDVEKEGLDLAIKQLSEKICGKLLSDKFIIGVFTHIKLSENKKVRAIAADISRKARIFTHFLSIGGGEFDFPKDEIVKIVSSVVQKESDRQTVLVSAENGEQLSGTMAKDEYNQLIADLMQDAAKEASLKLQKKLIKLSQ